MADDDEKAKNDFNDILNSIDRKFEIIHTKWSDCKHFEVKFRTQIQRNNEDFNALCDEWVDLFSDVTRTVWAKKISNTGPKIRFRKQYQCWTHGGKVVQKELLFDAKRCKATLDMKVLTDNPLTRRKNKHIRLGLNVVVKVNFIHLHTVDTSQPFAFFVHTCEPLPEAPKPVIQPNDRLPQLVAEMVQKGLNSSHKLAKTLTSNKQCINNNNQSNKKDLPQPQLTTSNFVTLTDKSGNNPHDTLELTNLQQQTIQLVQSVPLQNIEAVKLELQPQLQQFTVVSAPQLDMSEHLLMCQPLMFDSSQVIPITTHNLPAHFVQLHSHNTQGQFL